MKFAKNDAYSYVSEYLTEPQKIKTPLHILRATIFKTEKNMLTHNQQHFLQNYDETTKNAYQPTRYLLKFQINQQKNHHHMQNFRKLQAYIIAKDLVKFVYILLQKFPQEERYGLCDQLRRSVISIPSNIAEGLGRATNKDKGHFIQIAFGSLMEVMAQVDIAHDLDYIATEDFEHIEKIIEEETKLLKGLINHFK